MKLLFLLLFFNIADASWLDFYSLKQAESAYYDKNYSQAADIYKGIAGDESKFNYADSLYKQKKYKDALVAYQSIKSDKLKHKALHNIGNSWAMQNKLPEAIKAYKEALEIEFDADTEFNLKLLEKKLKDQQDKKNQDKKDQNKKDQNKKDQDKKDQDKKDQSKKDQNKKDQNKKDQNKKDQDKKDQNKKDQDKKDQDKKDHDKQDQNKKDLEKTGMPKVELPPISDMEERKWQRKLNKMGIKTLLLPLNPKDGVINNEITPW